MISLTNAAVWLPNQFEDSEYISQQSGIDKNVVETKMGIIRKCRAPADIHPSEMAIRAAKFVLANTDPKSIDLVIWSGSEYKDYPVWSAGIFVQKQLGLCNAFAFDASARCSSNVLALRLAKDMMTSNQKLKKVLICGGHRTGDLVNYQDPNARFLYNLSDGGSAMLVDRSGINPILESHFITDGDFSLDVIIPGGGTKQPTRTRPNLKDTYLCVPDMAGMRDRLANRSIQNFLKVIKTAASSSLPHQPIDYLALLHMKRSAHDEILNQLELQQNQSQYMDRFGHFGAPDQVLSLGLAENSRQLKKGNHLVLASAGIGYTWSAISIQWNQPTFSLEAFKQIQQ